MITYSKFPKYDKFKKSGAYEVPTSPDYRVYINGEELPVYTSRISSYPFNRTWPGYQRPIEQSELVSFVNLVTDEQVTIEVEPLKKVNAQRVMLKPYAKEIVVDEKEGRYVFTLKENGGYVFELDDYHGLLYIFNNKPVLCESPESVSYYFGPGVYFVGNLRLKSNESIYLDKDAYIYGSIFAEEAENVVVYGNGIFDDSHEERFSPHCSSPYNGNIRFHDCKNVKIAGIGFQNSATWCVNLFHCFDVEIDGINVFGQWRYNTDGVDIVNCQRITIRNSFIHSFDDTITIKGYSWDYDTDNCDMLFERCVLWCDWGRTCELGLETGCREYRNIVFRNCDLLRAGSVACDIQNGDCAEIHDITFENIRVELEGFYTVSVYQANDAQKYEAQDSLEVATIVSITNKRYREREIFEEVGFLGVDDFKKPKKEKYASVCDVQFKDIFIYADEKVLKCMDGKCAVVKIKNSLEGSEYKNITIENVVVNGERLTAEQMRVDLRGIDDKDVHIK